MEWYWGFLWGLSTWGSLFIYYGFKNEHNKKKTLLSSGVSTEGVVTKKWDEIKTVDGRAERHEYISYDFLAIPSNVNNFDQLPYKISHQVDITLVWKDVKENDIIEILYLRDEPWNNNPRKICENSTKLWCIGLFGILSLSLLFCGVGLPLLLEGWTSTIVSVISGIIYYATTYYLFCVVCEESKEKKIERIKDKGVATDEEVTQLVNTFGNDNLKWQVDFKGYSIDTDKYKKGQV